MPPKAKKEDTTAAAEEKLTRIAIVSADRCRPKKCRHECKKSCPVVKIGAWTQQRAAQAVQRRRLRLSLAPVLLLTPFSSQRQAMHRGKPGLQDRFSV